jgi:hypothetical protein
MIKFRQGCIENMEGIQKDVVVKAACPNKLTDAVVGGGLVLLGIIYLTRSAFRHGSEKHEEAEFNTMVDLGIIND